MWKTLCAVIVAVALLASCTTATDESSLKDNIGEAVVKRRQHWRYGLDQLSAPLPNLRSRDLPLTVLAESTAVAFASGSDHAPALKDFGKDCVVALKPQDAEKLHELIREHIANPELTVGSFSHVAFAEAGLLPDELAKEVFETYEGRKLRIDHPRDNSIRSIGQVLLLYDWPVKVAPLDPWPEADLIHHARGSESIKYSESYQSQFLTQELFVMLGLDAEIKDGEELPWELQWLLATIEETQIPVPDLEDRPTETGETSFVTGIAAYRYAKKGNCELASAVLIDTPQLNYISNKLYEMCGIKTDIIDHSLPIPGTRQHHGDPSRHTRDRK